MQRFRVLMVDIVVIIVFAIIVANLAQAFLIRPFVIPSGSMQNTLEIGDTILVNRLDRSPERGDIIVFSDPDGWMSEEKKEEYTTSQTVRSYLGLYPKENESFIVKRVIGLPGDEVSSYGKGSLFLNGKRLSEPYLPEGESQSDIPFHIVVPENGLWVMGDNRDISSDSRFHQDKILNGSVPMSEVTGEVFYSF